MDNQQDGGRARNMLIQTEARRRRQRHSLLPVTATVTAINGALVQINDEIEWIGRIGVKTHVGSVGVVFPLAGGGRIFASAKELIEAADISTTGGKSIEDELGDKRDKSVPVPQTEVKSSQGNQDLAQDIADQILKTAGKRDKSVPVPQADVDGLINVLQGVTNDLADKRDKSVPVPQADVNGLINVLQQVNNDLADKRDNDVQIQPSEVDSSQGNANIAQDITGVLGDIAAEQTSRQQEDSQIREGAMSSTRLKNDEVVTGNTNEQYIGDIFNLFLFGSLVPSTTYQLLVHMDVRAKETDGRFNGVQFGMRIPQNSTISGSIVSLMQYNNEPVPRQRFLYRINSSGATPLYWSVDSTSDFDCEIRATIVTPAAFVESVPLITPLARLYDPSDTITILAESNMRLQVIT